MAVNIYNIRIQHGTGTNQGHNRDQVCMHFKLELEIQEIILYFYHFYFLNFRRLATQQRTCLKDELNACDIQGLFYLLGTASAIAVRIEDSSMRLLEIFIQEN